MLYLYGMDLGAFGEWWVYNPGAWWDAADWGTVPTWVGSILTSLSVMFALSIIVRDRNALKRAAYDNFLTWTSHADSEYDGNGELSYQLPIHVINNGTGPILYGLIYEKATNGVEKIHEDLKGGGFKHQVIEPNEKVEVIMRYYKEHNPKKFTLKFADARGQVWYRNVLSNKRISDRKIRWRERQRIKHLFVGYH